MPTDPKVFSNHGDAQSPSVQVKTRKITKTAVAPFFFFFPFFLPNSETKLIQHAGHSAHRGATHESALQVANFSPFKDTRFHMKCENCTFESLKSPKNPLPFVRLIIAQEETIDIICI